MSDVPTLKEELDRKSLNALAMVQADKENFRISEKTYEYAMKILWEAFAGIVDGEFVDIMEQMDAEPYLKENQILYKRWQKGEEHSFVLVEFDAQNNTFALKKNGHDSWVTCPNAKEQFPKLHSNLISKGYIKSVKQNT